MNYSQLDVNFRQSLKNACRIHKILISVVTKQRANNLYYSTKKYQEVFELFVFVQRYNYCMLI